MVKLTKEKLKYSIIILSILFLQSCANQLPPGGGDLDTTPPVITEGYPTDGTINFKDDHFELSFSEYVDKRSLKDAIFISPAIDGNLELDWTNKTVDVYFPNSLKQNVTYVVTIGTDVVDYNNKNRMSQAYTFAFSTGNKIDKRIISGKVYDKKPDGVMIFAYKVDTSSINPLKVKPDYISQTGKNGTYKLSGLAEGKYRVFAINDEYHDLLYQPQQDKYGAPFKEISLIGNDTLFTGLDFLLTQADTVSPRLISATMTDKNHILVKLSKNLDTSLVSANNFIVVDSTKKENIIPRFAFKGNTKNLEMVLVVDKNVSVDDEYILIAKELKDELGNTFYQDTVTMIPTDKADTTKPGIFKTDPVQSSNTIDYQNQRYNFYFNDAVNVSGYKSGISFTDTSGNKVDFNSYFKDDGHLVINPLTDLLPKKDYVIKLNFKYFKDIAGNYLDSVYQYKFKTISGLDFTGVSGKFTTNEKLQNPVLILESTDNDALVYKQNPMQNGSFKFERIQPGNYSLWAFDDKDSTKKFNYGWVKPFKTSDRFSFYPDTLKLRSRWIVTDVKMEFK